MSIHDSPVKLLYDKQGCHLHGYELNITVNDCKTVFLQMATCLGTCISVDVPTISADVPATVETQYYNHYTMKQMGKCCRTSEKSDVTVELDCYKDGRRFHKYHVVKSALSCECFICQ